MAKTKTGKKKVSMNAQFKKFKKIVGNVLSTRRSSALSRLLNPGKDINFECGYPDTIEIQDYKKLYLRNGVANRVVKLLPQESWVMNPIISENEDEVETPFEKEWKQLEIEKTLFAYLQRIDILSGIGQYGVLLMGISDGKKLNEPVEGINLKTGKKVGNKKYELLFLKPFDQSVVTISSKNIDVTSPRFGMPEIYDIQFESTDANSNSTSNQLTKVHWTRVLHVADERESSEIFGIPRMQSVYNRLLDIRKILGGSGEMFWKGGFPGYSFETQPEPGATPIDLESLKDQIEDYSNGLQRYLATEGITVKSLAPQVADPKGHIETNMRNIAISKAVPYRIFLGTEESKLASTQDTRTWNKRLKARQEKYITSYIIRPFIDRLMAFGVLTEVEYTVTWPDLNAPSDEDVATVADKQTSAMAKYTAASVDNLIAPFEYFTMVLGFSDEEARAIEKGALFWVGLDEIEEEEPNEPEIDNDEDN